MSKKLSVTIALVGMCALSLLLVNCGSSSSRPSGILYVLTQGVTPQGTPGLGSNVSSFAIDLNSGGLSLINSNASTCSTAATPSNSEPCGLPLDILLDPTGATALVLNQGVPCQQNPLKLGTCAVNSDGTPTASVPPTVYPYTVNSDGSLSSPGTPTYLSHPLPSNPADTEDDVDTALTMVRDAAGQFLFVINQGSNPTPANCPHEPDPTQKFDACPSISVFKISATSLTLAGGNVVNGNPVPLRLGRIPTAMSVLAFPAPGAGTTPPPDCGFAAGGSEEFLFVTNSYDLSSLHDDNTLSVYCVSSSGTLTDKTPTTPLNPQPGPLSVQAVNTNSAGQNDGGVFVYVGSQTNVTGSLSVFQMCTAVGIGGCVQQDVTNVLLKPVGTSPTTTGQNPVGMVVDPTNQFLYVVCNVSSQVYAYLITTKTGVLTAPVNQATGLGPVSMALHPSINNTGQFLFTSNSAASNISGFDLSTTTDAMISTGSPTSSPSTPSGMTVH